MKIKMTNIFVAFFAVIAMSSPVVASEAKSLVELLDMIESAKISETAEYRQREADFLNDQRPYHWAPGWFSKAPPGAPW